MYTLLVGARSEQAQVVVGPSHGIDTTSVWIANGGAFPSGTAKNVHLQRQGQSVGGDRVCADTKHQGDERAVKHVQATYLAVKGTTCQTVSSALLALLALFVQLQRVSQGSR